jgi:hypothetical protein
VLSLLAFLTFVPETSPARTWIVTYDPEDPVGRVEAAVEQASSGDSIVIEPGIYYEHIPIGFKSICVMSRDGPETTILNGSQIASGRERSVLYSDVIGSGSVDIKGLTLQAGGGAWYSDWLALVGGAIALWNGTTVEGSVRIDNCVFSENHIEGPSRQRGGALFLRGIEDAEISNCRFDRNTTEGGSGGHIDIGEGSYKIDGCSFELREGASGDGTGINHEGGGSIEIRGCRFEGHGSSTNLFITADQVALVDNAFLDVDGIFARRVWVQGINSTPQSVVCERNVFRGPDHTAMDPDLWFISGRGDLRCNGNTFVRTTLTIDAGGGSAPFECSRNIFYESRRSVLVLHGGTFACNVSWPDSIDAACCGVQLDRNTRADPLFCDLNSGDVTIAKVSPCAADRSPPGCGQIGALGVVCELSPVRETTWGVIRFLFR